MRRAVAEILLRIEVARHYIAVFRDPRDWSFEVRKSGRGSWIWSLH
jgi:hypothetical protein